MRVSLVFVVIVVFVTALAQRSMAQAVIARDPVEPTVTYYEPGPVTNYYVSPRTYYAPTTRYYAPSTVYYAPAASYYRYATPVTTYYAPAYVRPAYPYGGWRWRRSMRQFARDNAVVVQPY